MRNCSIGLSALLLFFASFTGQSVLAQTPQTLLAEAANAMGGMAALRALRNEIVEADGKQFDTAFPLQFKPGRQITSFRYTLIRDLDQPRMRLEWEARQLSRNEDIRYVEIIDGSVGLLQEGSGATKTGRLHSGRLATRLRDGKRSPSKLIQLAATQKSLRRLPDRDVDGMPHRVLSFKDGGDEFHIFLDPKTHLPTQADLLDSDPLEGDTSYVLRYSDWRKTGAVMMPFGLRYEINGRPFQEEQIKSIRHNTAISLDAFALPQAIRNQKPDTTPIASQWILRRMAGAVSYQDFGRAPNIEWIKLADGVHKVAGGSHATVVVEMRDHVIAVEGPLYEARTAPVVKSIKERFPSKPIRYVVPTHHHLDHSGGIRAFMADGAAIVTPFVARDFYLRVARSAHTRQPDSLERNKRAVVIEAFGGAPRVFTDGSRRVEVHPMPTSHAEDIVLVYLPAEKIVIEADHISPRNGQVRPAPLVKEFVAGLDRLNLDVATIVGIHGDTASMQATREAAKAEKK